MMDHYSQPLYLSGNKGGTLPRWLEQQGISASLHPSCQEGNRTAEDDGDDDSKKKFSEKIFPAVWTTCEEHAFFMRNESR